MSKEEHKEQSSNPVDGKALAIKAIHTVKKAQYAMKKEQDKLASGIKTEYEKAIDKTMDNFPQAFKAKVEQDLESIKTFNDYIKDLQSKGTQGIPYGITHNKMFEILDGVRNLPENDIIKLATGEIPKNFDNKIKVGTLPKLANGEFWGSSQPTYYSAALANILMMQTREPLEKVIDLNNSAIAHTFSFRFSKPNENPYISSQEEVDFSIFHSGYSFGGSYGSEKEFAPQDCGTFVGKIYGAPKLVPKSTTSTADLVAAYRSKNNISNQAHEFIPQGWDNSPSGEIVKLFDVNNKPAEAGDIYIARRFNKNSPETSLGVGGHNAIILGTDKGEYVTLGSNRDMPGMEGNGLQSFTMQEPKGKADEPYKKIYVLKPSQPTLSQENLNEYSELAQVYKYDNLNEIITYFDKELVGVDSHLD